jgi:hypothetical protein
MSILNIPNGTCAVSPPAGATGPTGPTGPAGPGTTFQTDKFAATAGQTAFVLSAAPTSSANIVFSVNGVIYLQGTDYTVAASTITWLNVLFVIGTNDEIQVFYQK